jgi:hypothetical protein
MILNLFVNVKLAGWSVVPRRKEIGGVYMTMNE